MGTRGEGLRSHGRLIALVWQPDEPPVPAGMYGGFVLL